jgi:hypothetical protein
MVIVDKLGILTRAEQSRHHHRLENGGYGALGVVKIHRMILRETIHGGQIQSQRARTHLHLRFLHALAAKLACLPKSLRRSLSLSTCRLT